MRQKNLTTDGANLATSGDMNFGGAAYFGTSEITTTPDGTTATLDLGDGNHQTLDCGSATGTITVTLTPPDGSASGNIIIVQDGTARDLTWENVGSEAVKWLGTEPTWSGDTSAWRVVSWRWDGTYMFLSATEST